MMQPNERGAVKEGGKGAPARRSNSATSELPIEHPTWRAVAPLSF
jgi:hypothetical protein